MKPTLPIFFAVMIGVLPVWADAQHRAPNRHLVYALADGTFEAVSRPGSGASHLWCAAADYVLRKLSVPEVTRIYMIRGIGPSVTQPNRKSVIFGVTPPAGATAANARAPLTLSLRGEGDSLSVAQGVQYCRDHLGEEGGIWRRN